MLFPLHWISSVILSPSNTVLWVVSLTCQYIDKLQCLQISAPFPYSLEQNRSPHVSIRNSTLQRKHWSFVFIHVSYLQNFYFCPRITSLFTLFTEAIGSLYLCVLHLSKNTEPILYFPRVFTYLLLYFQPVWPVQKTGFLVAFPRYMEPLLKPHVILATSCSSGIKAKLIYNLYMSTYKL